MVNHINCIINNINLPHSYVLTVWAALPTLPPAQKCTPPKSGIYILLLFHLSVYKPSTNAMWETLFNITIFHDHPRGGARAKQLWNVNNRAKKKIPFQSIYTLRLLGMQHAAVHMFPVGGWVVSGRLWFCSFNIVLLHSPPLRESVVNRFMMLHFQCDTFCSLAVIGCLFMSTCFDGALKKSVVRFRRSTLQFGFFLVSC